MSTATANPISFGSTKPKDEEEHVRVAVRQRTTRGTPLARRLLEDPEAVRARRRNHARPQPARAPAFLRDAPAGAGRRPARDPADARARRPVDDPDLHARAGGTAAQRVREVSSEKVSTTEGSGLRFNWHAAQRDPFWPEP